MRLSSNGFLIAIISTLLMVNISDAARPNILFIICDDLQIESTDERFQNHLSIDHFNDANHFPHTPKIDSLANAGLEFTRAYTSSTVCAPARYTCLTGRYAGHNQSHYYIESQDVDKLIGEEKYLGRIENTNIGMETGIEKYAGMNVQTQLSKAGYLTGLTGKWHIGPHVANNKAGWDAMGWTRYPQDADPALDHQINSNMKKNQNLLESHLEENYGWDVVKNVYLANTREIGSDFLNVHNIEWNVQGAFEFLDEAALQPDKPWFLYFSTTLNHGPDPWSNQYKSSINADVRYTGDGYYPEGVVHENKLVMPSRQDIMDEVLASGRTESSGWTALIDKAVGALLDKLEEMKIAENTMVIFTSDHGYDRYGKASLLEGGVRVPLFIVWKNKILPGKKIHELVQNIDYAPTFYHYAGILDTLPEEYFMNGKSLHPYIENPDQKTVIHDEIYAEIGYGRSIMTLENKYIAIRYPNKIIQQIENGKTWDPFMDGDPLLSQPYLLKNPHLGHYSSKYNTQYFNVDQYYSNNDDPENYVNILYENNDVPIPEDQLPQDVKEGRDGLQEKLSLYLNQFESAYFGEFHDGVFDSSKVAANPVEEKNYLSFYHNGHFSFTNIEADGLTIYNTKGEHVISLPIRNNTSAYWNKLGKRGTKVTNGLYFGKINSEKFRSSFRFVI